jgi:DNA-binding NarL/FixJ family response regulator
VTAVYLCEDHLQFRRHAELFLQDSLPKLAEGSPSLDVFLKGSFGDGQSLCQELRKTSPPAREGCLVILDIAMPDMDGFETAAALHQLEPGLLFLFLTGLGLQGIKGLKEKCIHGIVPKDNMFDHLLPAIKQVLLGGTYFPQIS